MTIDIGSGETGFDQGTMNALRDLVRNSGFASTSTLQAADATVRAALADACERELKAAVGEGAFMLKQAISSRDKAERKYQRAEGKLAAAKKVIRATRVILG